MACGFLECDPLSEWQVYEVLPGESLFQERDEFGSPISVISEKRHDQSWYGYSLPAASSSTGHTGEKQIGLRPALPTHEAEMRSDVLIDHVQDAALDSHPEIASLVLNDGVAEFIPGQSLDQ